jgi:hypothetical protein
VHWMTVAIVVGLFSTFLNVYALAGSGIIAGVAVLVGFSGYWEYRRVDWTVVDWNDVGLTRVFPLLFGQVARSESDAFVLTRRVMRKCIIMPTCVALGGSLFLVAVSQGGLLG